MASIIGKEIIVPPEPGLMGAFGVALEINRRINMGTLPSKTYDLNALPVESSLGEHSGVMVQRNVVIVAVR